FGRIRQHFGKHPLTEMVGAGASNKDAAGAEAPHGAVIDFLVAADGPFEALLILSERRRIQDDGVVSDSFFMTFAQEVEGIRFDALDIRQAVSPGIRSRQPDRRSGDIDGFHMLTGLADLNRKTSGITKGIERPPARVASR